jgi:L-asparaginase II
MPNPVLVEVIRGATVESLHRGVACVVDRTGAVVAAVGDAETPICPRSALKPLQALPLIESGAAGAFNCSDEEIALACASHSGEPMHVERVAAWLARMGMSAADLDCGAHMPGNESAARALLCAGEPPSALHNNCSGKHAGFLCCAAHYGVAAQGYVNPDHPVQRQVLRAIGAICEYATDNIVIDGCSAPNVFMPLRALALGWARLPDTLTGPMKAHPLLVSGTGRPDVELVSAMAGGGVAKVGAEGVFAACLPERGLGFAVKIDDGAGRAAIVALAALLQRHHGFRGDADVSALLSPAITNWRGTRTGFVRAAVI